MTVQVFDESPVGADPDRDAVPAQDDPEPGLPTRHLVALTGTGAFAVWTSLTCFVC